MTTPSPLQADVRLTKAQRDLLMELACGPRSIYTIVNALGRMAARLKDAGLIESFARYDLDKHDTYRISDAGRAALTHKDAVK